MPNTETSWSLPTPDAKTIYGLKNSAGQGAKSAIFIAHGLGEHQYGYQVKRAADYFAENGFDTFRFNFYDGTPGARRMEECTLLTHAEDLNTILAAFAGGYEKVFLIGHSYGGTTIMLANPENITAASLWDPSYDLKTMNEDFASAWGRVGEYRTITWGSTHLVGEAMFQHANTLDEPACIKLAKDFKTPLQVVFAGDGYYVKKQTSYHSFSSKNRADVVEGTVHCFYEGQSCEDLLQKTHNWFKSFL